MQYFPPEPRQPSTKLHSSLIRKITTWDFAACKHLLTWVSYGDDYEYFCRLACDIVGRRNVSEEIAASIFKVEK
jgi:hypothetical protein